MINVLLAAEWGEDQFRLQDIACELRCFGVRARLVHDVNPTVKHRVWTLGMPTKVVSMFPLRRFVPVWAEVWHQKHYDKIQEYTTLEQAGLPVPKWVPVYPGAAPDLSGFDEHVVVKPSLGGKGAFVRVVRRGKVKYRPIKTEAMGIVSPALVAQEYIYTGAWPVNYRVGTVFGEPIYMFRAAADGSREPFIGTDFDSRFFAGKSIVASGKKCTVDDDVPKDVIDLARFAHSAFPDIPLLGTDIVRDIRTKKLFVLEVNACGRTYNLMKRTSERHAQENGIDIHGQFGGVKAVARGIYRRLSPVWKEQNSKALNCTEIKSEALVALEV